MQSYEYQTLFALEDTYWWYVARRELVRQMLAPALAPDGARLILDVGSGTGANERVLGGFGRVVSTDVSPEALRFCRTRGLERLAACSGEALPFAGGCAAAVTALDILEHLDDDLRGMREIHRVLAPGGVFLITVPAFGFLWSEHDEALHHRRRYTAYELRNKLTVAGFEVERSTYFITLLFFPILVMRLWQGVFKKNAYPKTSHVILPRWLNSAIEGLLALERFLCRFVNLPFGVSIVVVARKPGGAA